MAAILKRTFVLLAIYAIALQGILAAPSLLPQALADPAAAVICHSEDGGTVPAQLPGHAGHDHCVLCGITAAADVPTLPMLGARLAQPVDVLRPDEPGTAIARQGHPQRARAPPRLV